MVIFFLLSLPPGRVQASDESAAKQQISAVPPNALDPDAPNPDLSGTAAKEPATAMLPATKSDVPREGDAIWLEEKIAPSTRWIENLVKPITVWMERKIQKENPGSKTTAITTLRTPAADNPVVADRNVKTAIVETRNKIISVSEASAIANARIPGNILRVKLLERENASPRYRVKIISTDGEMHILYIDAFGQELMTPQPSSEQP